MTQTYYYKDKPYKIVRESAIKIGDTWIPTINYKCLYKNADGMYWTRFKTDFFNLFKPEAPVKKSKLLHMKKTAA